MSKAAAGVPNATGPDARRKGRPRKDHSPETRELLLAAARKLLQSEPPSRINRLEIARIAGVDPGLVRYYFGDKERLLHETAVRMVRELRDNRGIARRNQTSLREKLGAYVSHLVDVLHAYPFLHDLLLGQIARAGETQALDLRHDFIQEPFLEVKAIIDQAVADGQMRPVNVAFFYVAMIGMCSFPMRNRELLEQLIAAPTITPQIAADYAKFVADLLLDGASVTRMAARPPRRPAKAA
jgi:AcrR family transcriptional regulator